MYRYAYYCSRCHDIDEYTTLPVESPECIVDHVETHDSGMISLRRDRDGRVVSDHYETGGGLQPDRPAQTLGRAQFSIQLRPQHLS